MHWFGTSKLMQNSLCVITMLCGIDKTPQNISIYLPQSDWMWEISKSSSWSIVSPHKTLLWIQIMFLCLQCTWLSIGVGCYNGQILLHLVWCCCHLLFETMRCYNFLHLKVISISKGWIRGVPVRGFKVNPHLRLDVARVEVPHYRHNFWREDAWRLRYLRWSSRGGSMALRPPPPALGPGSRPSTAWEKAW